MCMESFGSGEGFYNRDLSPGTHIITVTATFSDGFIKTRSLMIADISPEESILLQENGIGLYYSYGCGVFIPQKGITAVNSE